MSDTAAWCFAVLLVSAGMATDGYLARTFICDWRRGWSEARSRRSYNAVGATSSTARLRVLVCAGLAAIGMTASVANAQEPVAQPANTTPMSQGGEPAASPSNPDPQAAMTDPDAGIGSAISVQFNLDFTNSYFYRGIRQQDKGLIVQPAARLTTRLMENDDIKLDGFVGMWNSFGPNAGSRTDDLVQYWYEADLYAGFTLTRGRLALTTSYTFLTSPSDAFETVQELGFALALDDSPWLKEWSLRPYATLAIETGADASDGAASDTGVYLELGIAPGFSFDVVTTPVTFTVPASVGLSLSDYYQDAGGDDDTFGFAQVGAKASIPLGDPAGGRFGGWTLNAGVSLLILGDHTKAFNNGDDTEVIGTVGLQWNF